MGEAQPGRPEQRVGSELDTTRLRELEALGARAVALVDRAIDNFASGLPRALVDLEDAVGRDDLEEVRTTAHRLRGTALNLGAGRFAEVALALELVEDHAAAGVVRELLDDLRAAGADAADALRAYQLARGSAGSR